MGSAGNYPMLLIVNDSPVINATGGATISNNGYVLTRYASSDKVYLTSPIACTVISYYGYPSASKYAVDVPANTPTVIGTGANSAGLLFYIE